MADCKSEISRGRRAATRGVFIGAAVIATVLFLPWTSVYTAPPGSIIVPLFAVLLAALAVAYPRWPVVAATLMAATLHLLPLFSGE